MKLVLMKILELNVKVIIDPRFYQHVHVIWVIMMTIPMLTVLYVLLDVVNVIQELFVLNVKMDIIKMAIIVLYV